ncbi:MAG: short-chain dehydrogenase [Acidimicrobiaceae bacterium]|nr:short-chain dehydrogenase [Acidimicrobiaceae bacterium]
MDLGISGRTALVTGASTGLGLASAQALAAEGVTVALASRSAEKLAAAAATIDGEVPTLAVDLADDSSIDTMLAAAVEALDHVDILVANAGGPPPGTFASTNVDLYPAALQLNLLAHVRMCKALIPPMRDRGWGRVVAITSVTVREPSPNLMLSNTARAGLTGFLKTTATEVARDGVTVNSIQPGLHATGRLAEIYDDLDAVAAGHPMGRIGDPADFGRIVAFLCSETANYVNGTGLPVEGGSLLES